MDPTPSPVQTPGRAARRLIGPFTVGHVLALIVSLSVTAVLLIALTSPLGAPSDPGAPVPGASFYRVGEAGTGLAIGDRPPPLAGEGGAIVDLDGAAADLTALEGRPVWVVFWATWCPPCQQETPDLQRAWDANRDTGLAMIAVNVQESDEVARQYADTYGLTYRIALDPTAGAFRAWGVFGLPTHYFIGRDGTIRDRWFGPLSLDQMQQRIDVIAADR
jgi:peroxiredoxin